MSTTTPTQHRQGSPPKIPASSRQGGRLFNRVAIITGTSSGLGSAIAHAFASEGAKIFCVDLYPSPRSAINPTTGKADDFSIRTAAPGTHELLRQKGFEATYHKADVTKAREVDFAVRACVNRYGRVDIMVNNAGISVESTHVRALRVHETSEEDYEKTMAINAKGVFLGCKYALKQMLEQEQSYKSRGWIVNTASVQGLVPYYGTPSYCASKGAVVMLTKQIALDYAKDLVHVNCLCPGFLETSMTQNLQGEGEVLEEIKGKHPFGGELGKVEDVAKAAVFLASDDAGWITGVPLPVDGGYMLR